MIIADFVRISTETLKLLSKFGIRMGDFKYVELYTDYERMVSKGEKISYIVVVLASRYNISQSSVYRILKRFKTTV